VKGRADASDRTGVSLVRSYPAATYFCLTFLVSWSAALAVALPHLLRRETLPTLTGVLMFPAMLLGPSTCGILMTLWIDGRKGLRELFVRIGRWRIQPRWYLVLLLPPSLVLGVLLCMSTIVSADYWPNFFLLGLLFGVPAGLFEEIGWMGFAFPKLWLKRSMSMFALLGLAETKWKFRTDPGRFGWGMNSRSWADIGLMATCPPEKIPDRAASVGTVEKES